MKRSILLLVFQLTVSKSDFKVFQNSKLNITGYLLSQRMGLSHVGWFSVAQVSLHLINVPICLSILVISVNVIFFFPFLSGRTGPKLLRFL